MENTFQILEIPNGAKYWLVRAGKGEDYEEFKESGIIGLRYNKLTLGEIDLVRKTPYKKSSEKSNGSGQEEIDYFYRDMYKTRLSKYYKKSKRSLAHIASRIYNFVQKMSLGDIVIVPYSGSKKFLVGVIIGEVYELTEAEEEVLKNKKKEELISSNSRNSKVKEISIARKRRKVKWLNEVDKSELNPKLLYTITMHQSVIDISEKGVYIDSLLSPMYIKDSKLYFNIKVTTQKSISLENWTNFYNTLSNIYEKEDKLTVKTRVESEGFISFVSEIFNWKYLLFYFAVGNYKDYKGVIPYICSFMLDKENRKLELEKKKLSVEEQKLNILKQTQEIRLNELEILKKEVDLNQERKNKDEITESSNASENKEIMEKYILEYKKLLENDISAFGLETIKIEFSNENQTQKGSDDLLDEE